MLRLISNTNISARFVQRFIHFHLIMLFTKMYGMFQWAGTGDLLKSKKIQEENFVRISFCDLIHVRVLQEEIFADCENLKFPMGIYFAV